MAKRKLYDEALKATSDNASLFYLKSERPVKKGWVRYVTFANAYDNSQAARDIEFGKLVDKTFYSLEAKDGATKSMPEWFTLMTHHFTLGELPAFRFTNATVGNVLLGYLEGYECPIDEVVTTG